MNLMDVNREFRTMVATPQMSYAELIAANGGIQ